MAVAGEVNVTAGAGATLRSFRGRPLEVDEPALLVMPDIERDVLIDGELFEGRRPP